MPVALWSVTDSGPKRLEQSQSFVEAELETWVEQDPTLVLDGLRWIGRQVVLPDKTRTDLIGITREGQLVVAELKRQAVDVATLSQAFHYALWFGSMEFEALEARLKLDEDARALLSGMLAGGGLDISILLIGTARQPALDRAAAFLASRGFNVPIRIVSFTPFLDASGQVVLAREVEEHEQAPEDESPKERRSRAAKIEWVQEMARDAGVADVFNEYITEAKALGLGVKPWPRSITIVPPTTRGRTLLYLAPKADGKLRWGYSLDNLVELYGADRDGVEAALGANEVDLDADAARTRLAVFARLMNDLQVARTDAGSPIIESPGAAATFASASRHGSGETRLTA
jgi:hypothetical protein